VTTARYGVETMALARELRPDLIVSDYQMRQMNGFELCLQLRVNPKIADTAFVVLRGFIDAILKVRAVNLGVDDYRTRPIDVPGLEAPFRASFRLKRLQDQQARPCAPLRWVPGVGKLLCPREKTL